MSVDLQATMPVAFSVAALVSTTRDVLTELLGGCSVPAIVVRTDRRWDRGRLVDPGRVLIPAEQETAVVGADLVGADYARSGPDYRLVVGDEDDGASLHASEYPAYPEFDEPARTVLWCTPDRTCVGVTVGAAVTLAAAIRGGGQIEECQLRLFPVVDPRAAMQALRLPDAEAGFVDQCVRFVRAIDTLNGWPSAVDAASWSEARPN
ncbi:hypothetical protein I0C86_01615 [Plantactinospora sp. S1510]|uniref:Uncharacterized protein n=1 Tax=Plantactinospora alkalitolerans TaxID=2789879 RepID=A0ABS0GND2_9ACTN|nr:hypothetical protein [Plantactinospora alkalitolerans]MBF9127699.1 hypothetical protein [Plantactinospora alkalitolerans]